MTWYKISYLDGWFLPLQIIFLSKLHYIDTISLSQHTHSFVCVKYSSILKEMKENTVRLILKSLNYYVDYLNFDWHFIMYAGISTHKFYCYLWTSQCLQPWIFIGKSYAEDEAPILWLPDVNSQLIGKEWCWERLKAKREEGGRGWDG